jgi:hypothetical protein
MTALCAAASWLALSACAGSVESHLPANTPRLHALSDSTQAVGGPLSFIGENFCFSPECATAMQFKGSCRTSGGGTVPVDIFVQPVCTDVSTCEWKRFGPLVNPFLSAPALCDFSGEVCPINRQEGTDPRPGPCLPVDFSVKPGLMVRKLRPVQSSCGEPVKRLLENFAYELEVELVGAPAVALPLTFTYAISAIEDNEAPTDLAPAAAAAATPNRPMMVQHVVQGTSDSLGADGSWIIPSLIAPNVIQSRLVVSVTAQDANGTTYSLYLPFTVHRPIDFRVALQARPAQFYPYVPESGCIGGGDTGVNTTYEVSRTVTRIQSKTTQYNETALEDLDQSSSTSHTSTTSLRVSNERGTSTRWGWSTNHAMSTSWDFSPTFQFFGSNQSAGGRGGLIQDVTTGAAAFYLDLGGFQGGSTDRSGSRGGGSSSTFDEVARQSFTSSTTSTSQARSLEIRRTTGGSATTTISNSISTYDSVRVQIPGRSAGYVYSQISRFSYPVSIIAYDLCMNEKTIGTTTIDRYQLGTEVAIGPTCAPQPKPATLPSPQCLLPPCE